MAEQSDAVATPARWERLCRGLAVAADERTYRQLIKAWSGFGRYYHSLAHLEACLWEFDRISANATRPAEVEAALWFHDAVYKTYSKVNEARSAEWAVKFLSAHGAKNDAVARIREYILATQHAATGLLGDAALVIDIDLSILGQPPTIYDQFERNVRKEYWWVRKGRFAAARIAVLQSFLNRPHIYGSTLLRTRYESAARSNLERAIDALRPAS